MSINAVLGSKSTIEYNGIKLYDVTKIGSIQRENPEVECTDLDSNAKEFIAGLKDNGSLDMEFNYTTDAGQVAMEADFNANPVPVREVKITLTKLNRIFTFNAWVKSFKAGEATPDGIIKGTVQLRITGDVASTAANLTALATSVGTLVPAFSATTYNYTVVVPNATGTVTVTPTLSAATIKVSANGATQTVISGAASSSISVSDTAITPINIVVNKTGGTSIYNISVVEAGS